jgi:S1-C subfamily serine protease
VAELEQLVIALFNAAKTTDRLARIAELEARGPQALAGAARVVLRRGDVDLVALIARALIRHAEAVPSPDTLVPLIDAARKRLGSMPATDAALDDAVTALAGPLAPQVLARLDALDRVQLDALAARLCRRAPEEVALHLAPLLESVSRSPARWSSLGPALVHAAPHVRPSVRSELRHVADRVIDQLRKGESTHAVAVVSVTWVLARIAEPGEALPVQLDRALDRLSSAEAAQARAALCARLATESAESTLLDLLRDPLPAARAAAAEAILAWTSPWIELSAKPPLLTPRYLDGDGRPLARSGNRLLGEGTADDHVLDERGRPLRAAASEYGGCLCCAPPRALVRRRGARLRCPASWEPYLRDGSRVVREADHALGGCARCDSLRPRVQEGEHAVCLDCGAGIAAASGGGGAVPAPGNIPPLVPTEHGRSDDAGALPRPPSRAELADIARPIRAAISANVFLRARDGQQQWSGSGIVLARDGDQVAILTNRHVVESDDGRRLALLSAGTVAGELGRVRVVWRASRGLDLAVVEGQLTDAAALEVMRLPDAPIQVGARVFAIGNPLGLAWSYSAGTLSAVRQWTTQEGLAVQVLQTDTAIAPGSSGGGLFHEDGRLLGVMSFARQAGLGGSVHFALGVEAVREALIREGVVWRGFALGAL